MTSKVYDLIVVGAGPAGSTLARLVAAAGGRVLLLDRVPFPRAKLCGGGLTARAWPHLPSVLSPSVGGAPTPETSTASYASVPGFRAAARRAVLTYGAGPKVVADLPLPILMVERAEFDAGLAQAAVRAGAEFHDGEAAVEVHAIPDGPGAATPTARQAMDRAARPQPAIVITGRDTYRGLVVAGADGGTSLVARTIGVGKGRRFLAVEKSVPNVASALGNDVLIDFAPVRHGYGWVFPKGDRLSVGTGGPGGGADLRQAYRAFASRWGLAADPAQPRGWVIPVGGRPHLARGQLMLVGDAAAVADPFTGEGIAYALHSATLAAGALCRALAGEVGFAQALKDYETETRREILADLVWAHRLADVFYARPAWFHRFGVAHAGLYAHVFGVIAGNGRYRDLPAVVWRYWQQMARPRRYRR